jgi:hypothetical protein
MADTRPMTQADTAPTKSGQFTAQGVTFHHAHRVLEDFAQDLARGLSQPVSTPADVFVGIHLMPPPPQTGRLRIGIQTEQILDKTRKRMWRMPKREEREAFVRAYDAILDLSPDNRFAYRFLPVDLRRKIRFGPHVFPDHDLTASYVDAPPLFVGWMNDRRRAVLDRLRVKRPVDTLSRKVFGGDLDQQLARQGAVLNVHFQDGIYSEFPRFLKACLAGKPVLSEPMSDPLIEGVHYLPLDADLSPELVAHLFTALRDLAARHRFRTLIEAMLQQKAGAA